MDGDEKIDMEGRTMKTQKSLWKSKSVWGAILAGVGGVVLAVGSEYGVDLSWVPEVLVVLGSSLFGIGIRDKLDHLEEK